MAGSQTPRPVIEVRGLTQHAEFAEAVRLQKQIWGFDEIELIPLRLFVVATRIGGQILGAFDGGSMIGFCLAIPGIKPDGKTYLHSHMLGVTKGYQNRGAGRLLKLEQRKEALQRGFDLVEWTFDPLEIKNAYFNLERLGAIVRRFTLNQYGTTSSHLHGGLPTDRCTAEWWIASARVRAVLSGRPFPRAPVAARIAVPAGMESIREADPPRAREIQKRVSGEFLEYLSKGLEVTGFERSPEAGAYLLASPSQESWEFK